MNTLRDGIDPLLRRSNLGVWVSAGKSDRPFETLVMIARAFMMGFISLMLPWLGATAFAATAPSSPAPAACATLPGADELGPAFAYDLQSPQILRFLSSLTHVPAADQARTFDAVVADAAKPAERAAQAAVAASCLSADAAYGETRAEAYVLNG